MKQETEHTCETCKWWSTVSLPWGRNCCTRPWDDRGWSIAIAGWHGDYALCTQPLFGCNQWEGRNK